MIQVKHTIHEAIKSPNSGWELQVNGQKVKDVKAPKPYCSVNFNAEINELEGSGAMLQLQQLMSQALTPLQLVAYL